MDPACMSGTGSVSLRLHKARFEAAMYLGISRLQHQRNGALGMLANDTGANWSPIGHLYFIREEGVGADHLPETF